MILSLINNIAFLVALVAIGQIVISRFYRNSLNRQVLLGLLFGSVALLGMANPLNFVPGVIFDGRSIVLSVLGVVGGVLLGWNVDTVVPAIENALKAQNPAITPAALATLKPGKNIVAIHCRNAFGGRYIDFGFAREEAPPAAKSN